MSNFVPSRFGQVNAAGDSRANFQRLYTGEVISAFRTKNMFLDNVTKKTIKNGKSDTFPLQGYASTEYHTPGTEINGSKIKASERIVQLDDALISSQFIADIDEAMRSYSVREHYTKESGEALSKAMDENIIITAIKAGLCTAANANTLIQSYQAFDDETFTANVSYANANDELKGDKVYEAIITARKTMELAGIDPSDAVVMLPLDSYYALFNNTDVSKLIALNADVGGQGSVSNGSLGKVMGMDVKGSAHLSPASLVNASGGQAGQSKGARPLAASVGSGRTTAYDIPSANRADFQKCAGVVMTKSAVAVLELLGITTQSEHSVRHQGDLMVSKYITGTNVLNPGHSVLLLKS